MLSLGLFFSLSLACVPFACSIEQLDTGIEEPYKFYGLSLVSQAGVDVKSVFFLLAVSSLPLLRSNKRHSFTDGLVD